jgi:hypothetical protein
MTATQGATRPESTSVYVLFLFTPQQIGSFPQNRHREGAPSDLAAADICAIRGGLEVE